MFYYKLLASVKRQVSNDLIDQDASIQFALPPVDNFNGLEPSDVQKPIIILPFVSANKVYQDESIINVHNNGIVNVKSNLPIDFYTGFEFRFKSCGTCRYSGYYWFSFTLQAVLTEEEYSQSII